MYEDLIRVLRSIDEYDTGYAKLIYDAADAIEELSVQIRNKNVMLAETINELPQWVSVAERLPESQGPFLTRYGFGDASIKTGQFYYGVLYYLYADAEPHWQRANVGVEVTHWMRIPKLPKEE